MIDKLPLKLTEGVTATLEGLVFDGSVGWLVECVSPNRFTLGERLGEIVIPWPEVAKRLRYREGEPITWTTDTMELTVNYSSWSPSHAHGIALDRISAILTKDAEAFRILHWCVINLGDSDARLQQALEAAQKEDSGD